jgi:hypothetical protein
MTRGWFGFTWADSERAAICKHHAAKRARRQSARGGIAYDSSKGNNDSDNERDEQGDYKEALLPLYVRQGSPIQREVDPSPQRRSLRLQTQPQERDEASRFLDTRPLSSFHR